MCWSHLKWALPDPLWNCGSEELSHLHQLHALCSCCLLEQSRAWHQQQTCPCDQNPPWGRWDFSGIRGEEAALSGWRCDSSRAEVLQIPFLVVKVLLPSQNWMWPCKKHLSLWDFSFPRSVPDALTPLSFLPGTCAWSCVGYRKWTVKL